MFFFFSDCNIYNVFSPFLAFGSLIHIEKFQTETWLGSDVDFGQWFAHQFSYAGCSPRIELNLSPIYYKWLASSLHPWFKLSLYGLHNPSSVLIPWQWRVTFLWCHIWLHSSTWGQLTYYSPRDFHFHRFSQTVMSSHTNSWE